MAKKPNAGIVLVVCALSLCAPNITLVAESHQETSSGHNYSVTEIERMFRRPKSTEDLLRNMKLAFDRSLLVQPAFFDPAVLKEFFGGTTVSDSESGKLVVLDDHAFPGMTVRVHQNSPVANYIEVATGPMVTISVGAVKRIFGAGYKEQLDLGADTDGHSHTPTTKGYLGYFEHLGPDGLALKSRSAQFIAGKDLVERPRCIPANQPGNNCGLEDDDLIRDMSLSVTF
jgi:hypothetical protein